MRQHIEKYRREAIGEDFIRAWKQNGLKTPKAYRQVRESTGKRQKIILEIDEVESFLKATIIGLRITEASWITYREKIFWITYREKISWLTYREKILKYIDLGMEYCYQYPYYINSRTYKILSEAILKLASWKTTFPFAAEELDLTETIKQDLPDPKFNSNN